MTEHKRFPLYHFDIMSNCNTIITHGTIALDEVLVTRSSRHFCKMDMVALRPSHPFIAGVVVARSGVR